MLAWAYPVQRFVTGAGFGFYSTARDIATFGQMFLDRGLGVRSWVLSPTAVTMMTTNQIPGVPGVLIEERHDEASGVSGGVSRVQSAGATSRCIFPARSATGADQGYTCGAIPRGRRCLLLRHHQGARTRHRPVAVRPVRERRHCGDRRVGSCPDACGSNRLS